ncbi:spindle assembly abnormal protein 6 homolog [Neocloeon triangulifer]|uniref:spindle assembly abnormal protein 6 homolog n=1 Tax=Neocloeon triangulifer TaxID=2078957 RepID=UPI00286FA033|nr:spindle assembly abnormal protein 6 homolog [Neocloeon triangulifer]XP_059475660.1 spindle assembly abnormal protein 6 homolog [Neocloeon triangulifer]XP_059475661.1 spindle assembly abnormal protein 6 homolog [Neocloeon triangulifer]XP_059475662.1 spindle assembly abnormal protein 6 homolog [Neocloeon triangulifer]
MDLELQGEDGKFYSVYSKIKRVYVKNRDSEERQRDLRIDLDLLSGNGPLGRQILSLQITDDDDPYFLFLLSLTVEDFKILRMEQGLIVDFDNFANQVVRLLDECSSSSKYTQGNRFSLVLNEDLKNTRLEFMETNEFKHLCHLSLKMIEGSSADIKKHMALKIHNLKDSLRNINNILEQKQQMLSVAYDKLEAKDQELERNRQQLKEEKDSLEQRVIHEAAEARENLTRAHMEWQSRMDKERQEMEATKVQEVKILEDQLSEVKLRNTLLSEKLMNTENNVRDLAKLADSTQKELKAAQKEVVTLRKQNSQIDMDYHKKDESMNSLKTKLAVLEQELKSKLALLEQQQEVLQLTTERKNELEAKIANMEASVGTKKASLQQLQSEMVKANEIITKQLNEIQNLSAKVKLRTEVALKQESLLEAREKEIADLKNRVTKLESSLATHEEETGKLKEELEKAAENLKGKDLIIRNNEQVIGYLTKQVKEADGRTLKSIMPTSLMAPMTSTPMISGGSGPSGFFGTSSVQPMENSAEHFLMRQKENIRTQAELRQKLGLTDPLGSYRPMEKTPLTPLLEQESESRSHSSASGDARKPQKAREPPKSRYNPTATTPAVKRSDILSAYFPKSA